MEEAETQRNHDSNSKYSPELSDTDKKQHTDTFLQSPIQFIPYVPAPISSKVPRASKDPKPLDPSQKAKLDAVKNSHVKILPRSASDNLLLPAGCAVMQQSPVIQPPRISGYNPAAETQQNLVIGSQPGQQSGQFGGYQHTTFSQNHNPYPQFSRNARDIQTQSHIKDSNEGLLTDLENAKKIIKKLEFERRKLERLREKQQQNAIQ
ncbi:hypothetical protein HK096_002630 [Nowakowskiella sp. JEL0078]|nr:hypothetical protein HK096_002630 [Nowakowskiella sp. JEL0078]